MSITRIVKGKNEKIIHKNFNSFNGKNFNISTLGTNNYVVNNQTIYDSNLKNAPTYQPENSINVYVGMFFDGTGNNRFNSDTIYYKELAKQGDKIKAETIPQQASFTKTNATSNNKNEAVNYTDRDSYWNPYSNIAKLFDLYKEKKSINKDDFFPEYGEHIILKQYIEGIGTKRDQEDDILGSGLARGSFGVITRVEEGIDKLVADQFTAISKVKKINKIVFDVFGFSRGAAAARHFCNEVTKKAEYKAELIRDPYDPERKGQITTGKKVLTVHAGGRLGNKLKQAGFLPVGETYNIEIRFLGLFDTVVSDLIVKENLGYKIGFGGLLYPPLAWAPIAQELMPDIKIDVRNLGIGHIFHIKAQHEWRKNFAFTPTNAGYTLGMYGSHSDIGGGYAELDKYETVLSYFDVPVGKPSVFEEMQKYRDFYIKTGISTKDSIKFENTYDHYLDSSFIPILKLPQLRIGEFRTTEYLGYSKNELTHKQPNYQVPKETIYDPNEPRVYKEVKIADHYVLKDIRYISNKYALIPMNLMLQEAIEKKVPFFKSFFEANPKPPYKFEYELPDDKKFIEYLDFMKQFLKTKNERGEETYSIPRDVYKHVAENYIHLSAHYGGIKNDFIDVKTGDHHLLASLVFINQPVVPIVVDGEVDYVRETYP